MASPILLGFWIALSFMFGVMTALSYDLRKKIPAKLAEAMKDAVFKGADVTKLRPIFNHLLWLEFFAFLVTSAAAFAEFLVLSGAIS